MTDLEKQKAEAEIAKWFWQPAEGHNFRYKYAVRTLTRFYEMVTPAADTLKLILEYLRTEEISGSISLLGKKVDLGSGWVAKDAWYQTAAGDEFAGTKQNKVRVYQTLMLASEDAADGDGPYTVEDGCQYAVEHKFYWNVAELPTLRASSSGIQYTMQSVFRDNETGLFSCVIEKRERVQQDVALYDTAKTIFETVKEEQHLGVKAADVPTTGQSASAADGVLVERQITKNPDCTSDVRNRVTTEKPVSDSVKQYRKTLRGMVVSTTDRNQENPVGTDGIADGETRRSEKTPGERYNNTKELSTAADGDVPIARSCQGSSKIHTDTDVKSVPVGDEEEEHVQREINKEKEVSYRKNEDGVTKDKTTVVREHEPRWAEIEWTGNGGTYKYVSFSHQPEKPTVETPENGTANATISQNTEGSYDGTITTWTPGGGGGATPGIIAVQTKTVKYVEYKTEPGGREKKRTTKIQLERGYASLSTAYSKWNESAEGYGPYQPFVIEEGRNGRYLKIISVGTPSGWEYVQ